MQGYRMPLAIALAVGIAATAYAQQTQQVPAIDKHRDPPKYHWRQSAFCEIIR